MTAGKPHPQPYILAAKRAGVIPYDGVAVENAPLGVQSACRAGLFCIGVNTGILDPEELCFAGARAVSSDCQSLVQSWPRILEFLRN